MRFTLWIVLFILSFNTNAQRLNNFGHFIDDRYVVSDIPKIVNELSEKFSAGENSILCFDSGYIILTSNCESSPSQLLICNNSGEKLYFRSFHQIINFTLSGNKTFCAFYNGFEIVRINLRNFQTDNFVGSNVFSVSNKGEVASFENTGEFIVINNLYFHVGENVYKIVYLDETPLFLTMNCIRRLQDNKWMDIFCADRGRAFDLKVFERELYASVKSLESDEIVFRSYCTNDLKKFIFKEQTTYLRTGKNLSATENGSNLKIRGNANGEIIRCPLNYYTDTLYQPVGNSYCEIQDYGSVPAYLHAGVDLMGTYLQNVYSVKKGFVKAILTTSGADHWRIAISNENSSGPSIGYLYAHLEELLIPFAVGDSVMEAEVVGQLVNFPVTGFVHCHFARISDSGNVWNGGWWTLDNPLTYMDNFYDSVPPVFEKTINNDVFAFRNVSGSYLNPDSLFGSVKIISKVYDLINSSWHVGVNKIRYNMSPLSSPEILLLDTFAYEFDFYCDKYLGGSYHQMVMNTVYSRDSVCFSDADYSVRDFFHIVTNSDGNDSINNSDSLVVFNTLNFADGSYIFRVLALDPSGNSSMDSMIIRIKNLNTGIDNKIFEELFVSPNPSSNGMFNITIDRNYFADVYNNLGEVVYRNHFYSGRSSIDLLNAPNGMYFLHMYNSEIRKVKKLIKY